VPSAPAVGIEIVSYQGVFRNTDVLIQYGAAHLDVTPDDLVVHDDAAFHESAGVDSASASENGVAPHTAGKNASAGYDAVDGLDRQRRPVLGAGALGGIRASEGLPLSRTGYPFSMHRRFEWRSYRYEIAPEFQI